MRRFFYRQKIKLELFDARYPFAKYILLLVLIFLTLFGNFILSSLLDFAIIMVSVVMHELAHGYTALFFGDKTAKNNGRLSLNPMKHIDLGTLLLPLILIMMRSSIIIGSAKPVPINEYNIKPRKLGLFFVSLAGIFTNLLLAAICILIYKLGIFHSVIANKILIRIILINTSLGVFNLIPIPPLDGSRILSLFLPYEGKRFMEYIEYNPILSFLIIILILRLGVVTKLMASFIGLFI